MKGARAWALLLVLLWTGSALQGQAFFQSAATSGLRPVVDLHGIWFDEVGNRHASPFNYFDREQISLHRNFDLPDSLAPAADLYLYFEGLAWVADVYLNGRLLVVTRDPFGEHVLPLSGVGLKKQGNEIRVDLRVDGAVPELYPKPFIGIFRQAWVLLRDEKAHSHGGPALESVASASQAVVAAPWSANDQYLEDAAVLKGLVSGLFRYPGDDPLVFPFRPSTEAQYLLADLGLRVLGHPLAADSLAFYNAYPIWEQPLRHNVHFWRQADGRPAAGYGDYSSLAELRAAGPADPDRVALLVLLLVPVLCLLVMKLATPRFYGSLLEFVTKTQIYMELIGNNKFLKNQEVLLLNFCRMAIMASNLSLLVYYLQQSGTLYKLGSLYDATVLQNFLGGEGIGPIQMLGLVLLVIVLANMLKYMFLNVVGGVYRVSNLTSTVQNLDVFASLPFSLLPLVPGIFIFFLEPGPGQVLLTVWQVTFGIWFLRRMVLIYVGLARLFSFSTSLKFLYICTLEILPWTILL